jgi:hypothetical protein
MMLYGGTEVWEELRRRLGLTDPGEVGVERGLMKYVGAI